MHNACESAMDDDDADDEWIKWMDGRTDGDCVYEIERDPKMHICIKCKRERLQVIM